jgi:IS30 family transposase
MPIRYAMRTLQGLTITADNGKEFAGHEKIKEHLKADVSTRIPTVRGSAG